MGKKTFITFFKNVLKNIQLKPKKPKKTQKTQYPKWDFKLILGFLGFLGLNPPPPYKEGEGVLCPIRSSSTRRGLLTKKEKEYSVPSGPPLQGGDSLQRRRRSTLFPQVLLYNFTRRGLLTKKEKEYSVPSGPPLQGGDTLQLKRRRRSTLFHQVLLFKEGTPNKEGEGVFCSIRSSSTRRGLLTKKEKEYSVPSGPPLQLYKEGTPYKEGEGVLCSIRSSSTRRGLLTKKEKEYSFPSLQGGDSLQRRRRSTLFPQVLLYKGGTP